MTQKADFQIQANEMNNRPAFPSCRRSVMCAVACLFLSLCRTDANRVLTEAFSFHPAGMFIA